MDISRLADKLRSQNFSPNDSVILSAINHPLTAAQKGADWFAGQVNRAANIPEQYDNPNPLAGYTPEQQVGGALNLAGLMQTSAFPFAPKSAGGVLGTITKAKEKNLNAGLIEKYLQEGKLSPEEMAQYEANALAMETPNLQKYNVENAEAQIPDSIKRAKSLGFLTQPSKEQYHLTRREWESNTPDLTMSDMGFHTGTLEQAQKRGKVLSLRELPFNEQSIIPITPNKYSYLLKLKDQGTFHADGLAAQLEKKGILSKGEAKKIQNAIDADMNLRESYDSQIRDALKQNDIDAIKYANEHEGAGDSYAYINPSVIRSRFAAFDPLRKASPSLLAGGALGSLLLNEEMNKGK